MYNMISYTYSEMITMVKLINISPHTVIIFLCVMKAPEINYFSIFPVFNTVLLDTVIIPVL